MLDKVRSFAGFLAFAGLMSIVLNLVGYNLRILMWIDLWGDVVGWMIRVGLLVGGVALFFVLPSEEAAKEQQVPGQ
ncbi:MAG TPA: hypothetical protein VFU02_21200 [Polyangiaceae bacterium]|nr:hypothetical protein [Polyangiaceae bacterium]